MVEGQGGRIERPSARKARHNKVYTAKGPRDRRVRLSADTAIQFYDVQDRLGYDRASEAVDWLISRAKGSIDKLFDTSSQQFAHVAAQNGSQGEHYLHNMFQNHQYGLQNFHNLADNTTNCISKYNSVGNSVLFPYMGNCSNTLEHRTLSPYQDILEKDQIQRMIMFNSKSSSRSGDNPSSSAPLFLHPIAHQLPETQSNGPSSDDLAKYYPADGHKYHDQINTFDQPSF